MSSVQGSVSPGFEPVRSVLERSIERGDELGASVAVVRNGELVVDLWGGWTDPEKTRPWQHDTITSIYSTNKTMLALCALLLVDRGELDVFAPVARYWPEFATAGKESIEVRHLLSHTSGLSGWVEPVTVEDLHDMERAAAILARQEPWWTPGSASGYQLIAFNHLVGELIRRITGQSPADFFDAELGRPLGADLHFGLGPEDAPRWSPMQLPPIWRFFGSALPRLVRSSPRSLLPGSVLLRTFTNPKLGRAGAGDLLVHRTPMNGVANARAVAQVQSIVSHGGEIGGRRFLSDKTIDLIFREQSDGIDLVLGVPLRFGIGYALPTPDWPVIPKGRVCWWTGTGGSKVINVLDQRLTFAYVMNKGGTGFVGDHRSAALFGAVMEAVQ